MTQYQSSSLVEDLAWEWEELVWFIVLWVHIHTISNVNADIMHNTTGYHCQWYFVHRFVKND